MFKIGNIKIKPDGGLFVIAGPCVIETEKICLNIADRLLKISKKIGIPIIFKASFDKANRSSISSFRGPGIEKGLEILAKVKKETSLALLTDIHSPQQAAIAAEVVDCLQVPAFLCRQTDLLIAAGSTGKPVNVKKGQFMSPEEMKNAVEKIRSTGNKKILLTERGTFFGYNRLVNDMTAIAAMKKLGCPVVFDATHSTQQPGGLGNASAGTRDMAPVLAKAAVAAGADGLFLEVHTNPKNAKSDAASIMPIEWVEKLLINCKKIYEITRN
ncbi:MAG: 3-deoxy-8-phosphooctulonate synthase [Sedimentisphaerales bacterium]